MKDLNTAYFYFFVTFLLTITGFFAPFYSIMIQIGIFILAGGTCYAACRMITRSSKRTDTAHEPHPSSKTTVISFFQK